MSGTGERWQRLRAGLRRWNEREESAALARFRERRQSSMSFEQRLKEVRGGLRRWGPDEVEAALREQRFRRGEQRAKGRRRAAAGTGLVAAAAVALGVFWSSSWQSGPADRGDAPEATALTSQGTPHLALAQLPAAPSTSAAPERAAAAGAEARRIAIEPSSYAFLEGADSALSVREQRPERVVVSLTQGRARFEVAHVPSRSFVVEVGSVRIEDLGTVFEVHRRADTVMVRVLEGSVRVLWNRQVENLQAGAHGSYPLEDAIGARPKPTAPAPTDRAIRGWREAAHAGEYGSAFDLLQQAGESAVRDEPADLLLAADVARRSGHPASAIAPLRAMLRLHAGDPRSPAAAFTLGLVLLRDLNRPAEAAAAFNEAQRLAPTGNLAEDAAARTVEAWVRAGNRQRAEETFARYQARYPGGRHALQLRRLLQAGTP
jgi:ferric-dicitrate binding protein FerR (iron transport regulator)